MHCGKVFFELLVLVLNSRFFWVFLLLGQIKVEKNVLVLTGGGATRDRILGRKNF
jgi:hypothetical protein